MDLTEYFADADGDELVYSVTPSVDHLVGIRESAGVMTLTPRAEGSASVVVTATDPNGWSASQELHLTVLPAPDPRSFDIDLVFVGPATEEIRSAALQMAERWTEVITGDLRDVPVPDNVVPCLTVEHRFHATVDDLVVFVEVESLDGPAGAGGSCLTRDRYTPYEARRHHGSSLPYMGSILLDTELVAGGREAWGGFFAQVILHEIGHALGFGPLWHDSGFLQDSGGTDPHFNGPLAIEAFDAAGGTKYTSKRQGAHLRRRRPLEIRGRTHVPAFWLRSQRHHRPVPGGSRLCRRCQPGRSVPPARLRQGGCGTRPRSPRRHHPRADRGGRRRWVRRPRDTPMKAGGA